MVPVGGAMFWNQQEYYHTEVKVLRSLIDERLKVQEAEANGITISGQAVDARVDDLAGQNNMSRQEFEQALTRSGILPEALKDQIRAELAWSTLIQRKLQSLLELNEVTEIEAEGMAFDPNIHEAVNFDEGEDGKVMRVVQKGYRLGGRVLRPALVIVGKQAGNG